MQAITFHGNLPGFVCGEVDSPGVVLLQEWWGVTDEVKAHALRIAAEGYRVLIPDLYKGMVGVEVEEARHLMTHLDWPKALTEVRRAVRYLRDKGAKKVAAMGYCMGAALAIACLQSHANAADCAVAFYGLPDASLCRASAVEAPLSMHFGELDTIAGFGDPESARAFAEKVRRGGGSVELHIYKDCGHSFLNAGPDSESKRARSGYPEPPPEQQQLAWQHVFDFLRRHLKGARGHQKGSKRELKGT